MKIDEGGYFSQMDNTDLQSKSRFNPKSGDLSRSFSKDLSRSLDLRELKNYYSKFSSNPQNKNVNLSKFFIKPKHISSHATDGFIMQNEILNTKNLTPLTHSRINDIPPLRAEVKREPFESKNYRKSLEKPMENMKSEIELNEDETETKSDQYKKKIYQFETEKHGASSYTYKPKGQNSEKKDYKHLTAKNDYKLKMSELEPDLLENPAPFKDKSPYPDKMTFLDDETDIKLKKDKTLAHKPDFRPVCLNFKYELILYNT